jgi:hypothetical protein
LRRILPILSFILVIALNSQGQARTVPNQDKPIVKFYPNPATSVITFDIQNGYEKGLDIQVYNLLGKMVYEQKNVPTKTTINLTEYNRGVYIYQVRSHDGKVVESGKFQVSK